MVLQIMSKIKFIVLILFSTVILTSCQAVSKKIDEKTNLEEKELSKWLNKSETEIKIEYGQPDKVEFLRTRNRNYIYISEKFKIKCERKFEINPSNVVIGFSSKNCF
jgi:hypothetical protein